MNRCPHFVGPRGIMVTRMSVTHEVALHQDLLRRQAIHLDEPVRWKPGERDLGRAGDEVGLEHERPASFELSSRDEKEEPKDGGAQPTRLSRIVGTERLIQLLLDLVFGKERQPELARERFSDRRLALAGGPWTRTRSGRAGSVIPLSFRRLDRLAFAAEDAEATRLVVRERVRVVA